jgi:hypothetical protein
MALTACQQIVNMVLCTCSKSKAALKKMKFPPELDLPVDYDKV